jgi:hypothetical protein
MPWQRSAGADSTQLEPGVELPGRSQEVRLTVPGGQHLPARVMRREGDELLILVMVPVTLRGSDARPADVVVEVAGERGLTRLEGSAVQEDDDLLRVSDLHSLEMSQRREYVRVRTARPVLVSLAGGMAPIEASSVDLSGGGMLAGGLEHLQVGARIEFRLTTDPDGPPVTGSGTVVRTDPDGSRAISFDSISEGNRRRLIRFLFDRQREERRRGLHMEGRDGQ